MHPENKGKKISVESMINAPVEKVWKYFTEPEHITKWNFASDDWHSPRSTNDVKVGGKFSHRMEAKDGSAGFDFTGTYTQVEPNKILAYMMDDERTAEIKFIPDGDKTQVITTFELETENPVDMQRGGWQAILDNFKKYTENS